MKKNGLVIKLLLLIVGFIAVGCSTEEDAPITVDESVNETVELGDDNVIRPNRTFRNSFNLGNGFQLRVSTRTTRESIRRGFIDVDVQVVALTEARINTGGTIQLDINFARFGYFSGFVQRNTTVRRVGNFSNNPTALRRFIRISVPRGANIDGARVLAFDLAYRFDASVRRGDGNPCTFCCSFQGRDRPNCIRNCGASSNICDNLQGTRNFTVSGTARGLTLGER